MNPSSPGWIAKHLSNFISVVRPFTPSEYYDQFRDMGFLYGSSHATLVDGFEYELNWTEVEKTKINLLDSLFLTYYRNIEEFQEADCILSIVLFYEKLGYRKSFFDLGVLKSNDKPEILEKIITLRIQTNDSIFTKNFNHILTNALLFIDALTYHFHLNNPDKNIFVYAEKLEITIINCILLAIQTRVHTDQYGTSLVKLLASSARYTAIPSANDVVFENLQLTDYQDILEKRYIIDLTSLALWNELTDDLIQNEFLLKLGTSLQLEDTYIQKSVAFIRQFVIDHKDSISLFNFSNPINHFYKQTTRTVNLLILRNKNRILKELSQSKELVKLLGQSTQRELDHDEKQLVKTQLLDICKTIPSLAIFILPGGSLLIPLLVKFIPQLLPSAFNENK